MASLSLYGGLRRHMAGWQRTVAANTVGDALRALTTNNPTLAEALFEAETRLRPHLRVLVNGHDIELLQGLDTPLTEADDVRVFPPIGGGNTGAG